MRVLVLALLVAAASASAIQPLTGTPKNQLVGACAAPPCAAAAPQAPKPMRIAKVEKAPNPFCDCIQKPECDCRNIQTVEPELKDKPADVFCGCLQSAGDCPCRPGNYQLIKDSCGCLHLKACPCRMEYIEPETKEKHLEPELKERQANAAPCGCLAQAVCPCRIQHITPEIKEPVCPCADKPATTCACTGLARN